jgi:membrane protease YdiL (CAAX protease family)
VAGEPDFESVPACGWTLSAGAFSSLTFGALHAQRVLGTLVGLAFAAARLWRGRFADAVLAHAICNAAVAGAALWGGRFDLWS